MLKFSHCGTIKHSIPLYFLSEGHSVCIAAYVKHFWIYMCIYLAEHASGKIGVHGQRHRSRPRHRWKCSLLLPASISFLRHRWGPRHSYCYQTPGLWDNLSLSTYCQRDGEQKCFDERTLAKEKCCCFDNTFIWFLRIRTNWGLCPGWQTWLLASLMFRTWTPFLQICHTVPT